MKTWIPFLGILLNLNVFFAAAVTGQDIVDAISNGDLADIQRFIDAGVNFDRYGSSPLFHAIDHDRIEIARAILAAHGIDINYPTTSGEMPIHYAVCRGSREMIRLLLADERCARNQMYRGMTPLQLAAEFGNTSAVEIFLEDPTVDRNIVSTSDRTALDYAIIYNNFDTDIVLLNDPFVVKDRIDGNGRTILHKIVQCQIYDGLDELERANRLRILEAVLHLGGIDINHQDFEGKTALHYAAESGNPEMILRLTAAGADSAILDVTGQNAVEYALIREPALAQNYLEALNSALDCSYVGLK